MLRCVTRRVPRQSPQAERRDEVGLERVLAAEANLQCQEPSQKLMMAITLPFCPAVSSMYHPKRPVVTLCNCTIIVQAETSAASLETFVFMYIIHSASATGEKERKETSLSYLCKEEAVS